MAGPQQNADYIGIRIFNGLAPTELPKCVPVTVDFTLQASWTIDLSIAQDQGRLAFVQSVFVDNSGNSAILSLTCSITGQTIQVPANAQGYFPLLATDAWQFTVSLPATNSNPNTKIFFLNVPVPACVWTV